MYDMPLRDYDPAIGRWVVQDPVIHHSQSTYSSFNGNPVLFADPSGGRGQMLDANGAKMFDNNGNYIWRADRVVPGEVSMAAYLGGGSTVEKMISKINGLSDAKKATLPSPHILLQMLMAEESSGGNWEKMFRGMLERVDDPPVDYKKMFKAKLKIINDFINNLSDWGSNVVTAADMFVNWVKGTGADRIVYINERVSYSMRDAFKVEKARDYYYTKYKNRKNLKGTSVTNFDGGFGLLGIIRAGLDPIEQFVGSCRIDIFNFTGKLLWFVVSNTTSVESFLYGIGPEYERSTFRPGGNMRQVYIWCEPLKK